MPVFTRLTATRRRVAAIGSVVLLAGALVTVAAVAYSGHGSGSGSGYRDYTGNSSNDDQCAKPVAERTGGWMCP